MKKLLALLTILLLPLWVIADLLPEPNDIQINNENWITENIVDKEIVDETNNDVNENLQEVNMIAKEKSEDTELHEIWDDWWLTRISFWYCNEWLDNLSTTLNYAINQWEPFKVCFSMWNSANQDIKVRIRLVDLVNWICSINDNSIYNYISPDDIKDFDEIVIPAWNYIVKEFNILYPIWIEWDQWACTMFNIIKDEITTATIAATVNRAYPMQFFVWTLDDIKNEIAIENIELSLDENKDLIMNFDIKNKWNLENLVELSGTISNIFWYNKKFSIEWWHVLPGGLWHVTANLWSIPSYGWLFNINFKTFATPYFSYDVSKSSIDQSLIEMKTFDFKTTYFKMPRLIIAIVIILILLIITMFKKPKQKVVYVNQQPTQPAQPQQPVQQQYNQWYNNQNISQQYQQPVQPQTQQYNPQQYQQNNQQPQNYTQNPNAPQQ